MTANTAAIPSSAAPRAFALRAAAWFVVAVIAAPIVAVFAAAVVPGLVGEHFASDAASRQGGLSAAALWHYASETLLYAGGTTLLAIIIALPAAWLTVMRSFPGAKLLSWALFLPFALPPYLSGYVYADFFDKMAVNVRGMPMAILITALALYPYIYLFARTAMRQQPCHIQSAARLMGHSQWSVFWRISVPLARPAMAVGAALVLMESLNDIAVAEHYGINPFGAAVYDLWLNRGDLRSSCRLAVLTMLVVSCLVVLERRGYAMQKRHLRHCDRCFECERTPPLGGLWRIVVPLLLCAPLFAGFVFPLMRLVQLSAAAPVALWHSAFADGAFGSVVLSLLLIVVLLCAAAVFVWDKRVNGASGVFALFAKLAQSGYALPGAILAQGFFVLAAVFSGAGVVAYGGLFLLVAACAARFFLIPSGALEAGLDKISPQLDAAARLMPPSRTPLFVRLHLPLLRPAAAMAAVVLLLESFKELPMTLILRPFGFDTLATVVYQYASDEAMVYAAPAAVLMTLAGSALVSAIFLMEGRDMRQRAR
ncbi:MAG: ABC transporter permease [Gammaproteobacteria bacterium]